jgi:rhodanese-related sulfurtransferase
MGVQENPPTVDTEAVRRYVDHRSARIVEVLMPKEYETGHIPGAIHVHFATIGGRASSLFSKDDTIVTYCHDEKCRASRIAAAKLQSLGYSNAYHYPGGKNAWRDAGLPLESAVDS